MTELKLIIKATKEEDVSNPVGKEYVFKDPPVITIGRGHPNNVPLNDPERTISRKHAQIVNEGHQFLIEDINSKNFTFLNKGRLTTGKKERLKDGDEITIGEYILKLFIEESTPDLEMTVIDPLVSVKDYEKDNPFTEQIEAVFAALVKIEERFGNQNAEHREQYLSAAIDKRLRKFDTKKSTRIFLDAFSETSLKTHISQDESEPAPLPSPGPAPAPSPGPAPVPIDVRVGPVGLVLDTALALLKDLVRIPYKFKGDFIGQTMWQDEESTFIYEGEYEDLKNYLLDSSSSKSDLDLKLERLKKASEKVTAHHLGMIEGYRAIAREGIQQLLNELDTSKLEAEILDSNILFKYLPILASPQLVEQLKHKISELNESDWGAVEYHNYRPIFIRAYLATISENDPQ